MSDKKKFLFNLHDFGDKSDEDDGPPPPPMFSEAELQSAKETAYAKGKKDGFDESQAALEKKITLLLENAKQSFLTLQSSEQERETRYEQEAAHLSLKMFESIYPAWVGELGPTEVENAIADVLGRVRNHQSIKIEVATALLAPIEERFSALRDEMSDISISFHGRDDLDAGSMQMSWNGGGAVRDTKTLSEQILQILKDGLPDEVLTKNEPKEDLAEAPEKRQNSNIDTETPDE